MTWKNPTPAELGADWIAERKDGADQVMNGHLAQFLLGNFPETEPELTWETIRLIMQAYPKSDFYDEKKTEAQKVCGELAAGPVEELLSFHGQRYIERFEHEARGDQRMAWMLGGTWQYQMSDEVWHRVQLAADYSYWMRAAAVYNFPDIPATISRPRKMSFVHSVDEGRLTSNLQQKRNFRIRQHCGPFRRQSHIPKAVICQRNRNGQELSWKLTVCLRE